MEYKIDVGNMSEVWIKKVEEMSFSLEGEVAVDQLFATLAIAERAGAIAGALERIVVAMNNYAENMIPRS